MDEPFLSKLHFQYNHMKWWEWNPNVQTILVEQLCTFGGNSCIVKLCPMGLTTISHQDLIVWFFMTWLFTVYDKINV
jgi:hypothetical protein